METIKQEKVTGIGSGPGAFRCYIELVKEGLT